MKRWIKKYPTVFRIVCAVALLHIAVAIGVSARKKKAPIYTPKKIAVHTRYLPKVKPVTQVARKIAAKKAVKKPVSRQRKLLRDLEESIAKIEQKRDNRAQKSELALPKKVDLSREFTEEVAESYQDQLVNALRGSLRLPTIGEVTLELRLAKSGAVLGLDVVKAASDENREYLTSHIQTITFPPFEGDLKQCDEQTFLLTFCND